MDIVFRGRAQRSRFEVLAERDMHLSIYYDGYTMARLGIRDSIMFLFNQVGWENAAIKRRFTSYRKLTLEFLSSLVHVPNVGLGFNSGLITFRLFDTDYRFNHREFAKLLGFPSGPDVFTMTQKTL